MTLTYQVLGDAGQDNALLVTIDCGQSINRLLFDCGDGCLSNVPFAEVQAIDHLLFSHLHMDHIGGFDGFFRCNYGRIDKANHIWGPPRTAEILHHRFQGFLWNLVEDQHAAWRVHDLHLTRVETTRFELAEAFSLAHAEGTTSWDRTVVSAPGYTIEALLMDHGTPSVAYVIRETPRVNVDPARLGALGLRPGPWLQRVRGPQADDAETIVVEGVSRRVKELQDALVTVTPGNSVAYLTDFLMDDAAMERLVEALHGVATVICESQYQHADLELAVRNRHMTAVQAATMASRANVGRLVLFHLSVRYRPEQWREILAEARATFPATEFPGHWAAMLGT
jgi:ribonuclease Z